MIKGSDIRVVWHPAEKRWLDPSGLVVTFQTATEVPTAGPRPLLDLPSTLPLPRTGTLPVLKLQAMDALPPVHGHLQAAEPVGSDAQDRRTGQRVPGDPDRTVLARLAA